MPNANGEMNTSTGNGDAPAKYACPWCGSTEIRKVFYTYEVFSATGDKLSYVRSISIDPKIFPLQCNKCGEELEVEYSEIKFV